MTAANHGAHTALRLLEKQQWMPNRKERKKKILDRMSFILRHVGKHHYLLTVTSRILRTYWNPYRALTPSPAKLMPPLLIEDSLDSRFRKAMCVVLHCMRRNMLAETFVNYQLQADCQLQSFQTLSLKFGRNIKRKSKPGMFDQEVSVKLKQNPTLPTPVHPSSATAY